MKVDIRRDTDDTQDDGSLLAINTRFIIDGEVRRRLGMELVAAYGATRIGRYMNPSTGKFALLVTSGGTIESVAL
jgi:hypothetical protein